MKKTYITWYLVLLATCWATPVVADEVVTEYRVAFTDTDRRTVSVDADYNYPGNTLELPGWGHPGLEKGWATFITGLEVFDAAGTEVHVSQQENGSYLLPERLPRPLQVRYTVTLNHDEYNWMNAGGDDARPRVMDEAIFMVTKTLFLGNKEGGATRVSFSLPEGWQVATPWKQESTQTFSADEWWDVADNIFVVGDFVLDTKKVEGFRLILAMDNSLKNWREEYFNTFDKILPHYAELFGGLPEATYLVAVSSTTAMTDGEAFPNSFHQIVRPQDISGGIIIWGNGLCHEMLHFWNGLQLAPKVHAESEYFKEGFTEYYTNLSMARAGLISRQQLYDKLARHFSRYFVTTVMIRPSPSLAEAGKAKMQNWMRIYGGGATLAFTLDMRIREKTDNEHSLDDVMRELYAEFGNSRGYTNQDIVDMIKKTTGYDASALFDQQVFNNQGLMPFLQAVDAIGLRVMFFADEFYVSELDSATSEQRAVLLSWLEQ